jgi:uncharacterized membrane protein YbhN (UPF0104 family)/tRNA A-37 threonylcarbamoyl transferase component Bud32
MRTDPRVGGPGFRFYANPAEAPRARRATDVLLAVAALVGLVLLGLINRPPATVESALINLLSVLPGFLSGVWQLLYDVLLPWALGLVVVALVRRRGALARDQVLATVLAVAVGVVAGRIVEASWPGMWPALTADEPPAHFPALRIAAVTACVATASPYLSHPVRRVSGWLVALGAISVALLGAATPTGALAAVLAGAFSAAAVHLAVGSCGGRPGLKEVRAALADLGTPMSSLDAAARQPAGGFLVTGVACDGRDLTVKVYGRDAHDAQLLTRLWRTVWYRGEGLTPTLSRLQQAEHEAFLTLLARQGGVPTQEVITAGVTEEDDALLVMELHGTPMGDLPADEISDDVLRGIWETIGQLHHNAIAHGQIDPLHLWVNRERVTLVDLSGAAVATGEDQRRTDEAQALVTSVVVAGVERGLATAHAALGPEGLARIVPYLQLPALSRGLRLQVRRAGVDLDDVRRQAAEIAGAPPADLQQLRRVTLGTVLQTGMLVLAFTALISGLAGLDLEDIATQLREANWWWVAFAALLVQTPRLTQAVSTLGASPRPLPLGPVYALQLAISYIMAVPATAARVAVNIRFFQRQGVSSASAVAVGAIDGFAGFVVQVLVLGSLLVFSNVSLDLQLDTPTSGGPGRLLVAVVVLAAVAVGVVLAVGPWRRAVVDKALELGREAWEVLRGLRSARRIAMLLGGNLATDVLFALSLAGFVRAFGYDVGLGELLVVNMSTSLLAGLMPVPGGIGVTEGALTVGLTAAGLPEETAFAVAITYRLASFYLPPTWGWFAFRWLQRNEYL